MPTEAQTYKVYKKVYIGSDHAGYRMKEVLKRHLEDKGIEFIDFGAFSEDSVDYPDIAREVGEKVGENGGSMGVLICGTGIGMSIAANKMKGVRAALCTTVEMAEKAREHNNANTLVLGSRIIEEDLAMQILDAFLDGEFSTEDRHHRRVDKLNEM